MEGRPDRASPLFKFHPPFAIFVEVWLQKCFLCQKTEKGSARMKTTVMKRAAAKSNSNLLPVGRRDIAQPPETMFPKNAAHKNVYIVEKCGVQLEFRITWNATKVLSRQSSNQILSEGRWWGRWRRMQSDVQTDRPTDRQRTHYDLELET